MTAHCGMCWVWSAGASVTNFLWLKKNALEINRCRIKSTVTNISSFLFLKLLLTIVKHRFTNRCFSVYRTHRKCHEPLVGLCPPLADSPRRRVPDIFNRRHIWTACRTEEKLVHSKVRVVLLARLCRSGRGKLRLVGQMCNAGLFNQARQIQWQSSLKTDVNPAVSCSSTTQL